MRKRKDISGHRFGMLTAISYSHSISRSSIWSCVCECGAEKTVWLKSLVNGDSVSCGCKKSTPKNPESRLRESSVVDPVTGCWNWSLRKDNGGYGRLKVQMGSRRNFRLDGAHRYSYEIFNGPIPDGLHVCHSCDNRGCINPAHLWLGTHKDNMQDMARKGRSNKGRKLSKLDTTAMGEGNGR